jgi:uncharacterized membrane protein
MTRGRALAFLLLVVATGLLLRLHHLGSQSLWLDESHTVRAVREALPTSLTAIGARVHPPLYTLLLKGWVELFGISEIALRSLSVVFGMLTILVVHRLGRLLFGEGSGLLAAGLVALSVFHIEYSQEARAYTLLTFLGATSYYFFARWPVDRRGRNLVGYCVATTLLMYTHSLGVLVPLAQNLHVLAAQAAPRLGPAWNAKVWLGVQGVVGALYLPWALATLWHASLAAEGFWTEYPTWSDLRYLAGLHAPKVAWLVFVVVLVVQLPRLLAARVGSVAMVAIWLGTSLAVPAAITAWFVPILVPRYMIVGSVPLYILAAALVVGLRPRLLRAAVIAVLVLAFGSSAASSYKAVRKDDWRGVTRHLEAHARPGDLIILHPPNNRDALDYYLRRTDLPIREFPRGNPRPVLRFEEASLVVTPSNLQELADLPESHDRVWLVVSNSRDPERLTQATLSRWYRQAEHFDFAWIELLLFVDSADHLADVQHGGSQNLR